MKTNSRTAYRLLTARFALAFLLFAVVVPASPPAPGNVSGTVYTLAADGMQTGWPNARITLRHVASGMATTTVSGPTGEFTFRAVQAGEIEITIELEGFEKSVSRLRMEDGKDLRADVRLLPHLRQRGRHQHHQILRQRKQCGGEQQEKRGAFHMTPKKGRMFELGVSMMSASVLRADLSQASDGWRYETILFRIGLPFDQDQQATALAVAR